jgi:hypothetical protein
MTTIRPLGPADWDDWRALWGGYLALGRPTSFVLYEAEPG